MSQGFQRELNRVIECRRAATLARYYRDQERRSIEDIARLLGRAPATVKAYLYDPRGREGARGQAPLPGRGSRLRRPDDSP